MKAKLQLDLAAILTAKYPHGFHVPADVDVSTFLEFGDDDWDHAVDVDVHELLAERKAIALIWDADMLTSAYPHLTEDQAWDVLQLCARDYTAEQGLTWDDIACAVNEHYPDAPEAKQRLLDQLSSLHRQVEALPADETDDPAAFGDVAAKIDAIEETIRQKGAAQ